MKTIEIDDELYRYIASQTQQIGESASTILRRLLMTSPAPAEEIVLSPPPAPKPTNSIAIQKAVAKMAQNTPMSIMQLLLNSDEFTKENRAIGRFMLLLSTLYGIDNQAFCDATLLKGRKRVYFSDNKDILLASGQTTKPKQIPQTPFWVITNTNTGRKQQMVLQLMERMGFPSDFIKSVVTLI